VVSPGGTDRLGRALRRFGVRRAARLRRGGEVLDGIGVPVVAEFPKPFTDEVVQAAELVIIMGCGDACPIYPDRRHRSGQWPPPSDNPWTYATSGTISPVMAPNLGASPSSRMRRGIPTI
jgi:hypothetical protein